MNMATPAQITAQITREARHSTGIEEVPEQVILR
jgi:hypothetical protein